MPTLTELKRNNWVIALAGANFISPLFRRLTAQSPEDVNYFTIYGQSDKAREKKFRKLLKKNKNNNFILILRDDDAELQEVLYVPSEKDLAAIASNSNVCHAP